MSIENESLKALVAVIEPSIKSFDQNKTEHNHSDEKLISEIMDGQARMKNVLLFSLSESNNNSSNDFTTINNIVDCLGLQCQPTHISF